jgi:hypothetical protein
MSFADSAASQRRIIGGEDATKGDWGWMLTLNDFSTFCGASLIHPYWVLTAAHCVDRYANKNTASLLVVAGLNTDPVNKTFLSIKRVIQHPDWDTNNFDSPNDIALLELNNPAAFEPISFILQDENSLTGSAMALGWGLTDWRRETVPSVLQQVALPLVTKAVCQAAYAGYYEIFSSQICAGFAQGGMDTCSGDSGGPLAFFDGKKWRQIGVTSYGGHSGSNPCADKNVYGVYTKISAYKDFIQSHLFSQIYVDPVQTFSVGEPLQITLKEQNVTEHPRQHVNLWIAFIIDEEFWFLQGSASNPHFVKQALPWKTHIDVNTQAHLILDIPATAALQGDYVYAAMYTKTDILKTVEQQQLDVEDQQSNIVWGEIKITAAKQ